MNKNCQEEIEKLKWQRDGLLKALKNMLKIYSESPGEEYPNPGWGQLKAGQYFNEAKVLLQQIEE